jgi:hypothetical protein
MNILCPLGMSLEKLRKLDREPLSYPTLVGIFQAYRNGYADRPSLVEAIADWQCTEAKNAGL